MYTTNCGSGTVPCARVSIMFDSEWTKDARMQKQEDENGRKSDEEGKKCDAGGGEYSGKEEEAKEDGGRTMNAYKRRVSDE